MTDLVLAVRQWFPPGGSTPRPMARRGAAVLLLAVAALAWPGALQPVADAVSEAWLAVAVFVAGTMLLLFVVERGLRTDLSTLLARHRRWQVPIGAALGALPGCGGAIVAVTQFTGGHLSFGGLVATLIATMGDAMFLLLAREPDTALLVLAISAVAGVLTGWALDAIHGEGFLRPRRAAPSAACDAAAPSRRLSIVDRVWLVFAAAGLVAGLFGAFQVDVDDFLPGSPAYALGIAGALLALAVWVRRGGDSIAGRPPEAAAGAAPATLRAPARRSGVGKVIDVTSFVTAWVVFAFVGYELLVHATGADLGRLLSGWGSWVPALAVLVGFIPGCGPQIVVTSLYLAGTLPLAAQLGNAIANDGDALFPALAVAPKAALVATLYSAVPALIVAYGWHYAVAPTFGR